MHEHVAPCTLLVRQPACLARGGWTSLLWLAEGTHVAIVPLWPSMGLKHTEKSLAFIVSREPVQVTQEEPCDFVFGRKRIVRHSTRIKSQAIFKDQAISLQ